MGTVRIIDEQEQAERARIVLHAVQPSAEDTEAALPKTDGPSLSRFELIQVMGVLARILGFRVQLLLTFLASAGLSAWAVSRADVMSIIAAGLFTAMVFLPMLYVAFHRG